MIDRSVMKHVKGTVDKIEKSIFPTLRQVITTHSDKIKAYNTQEQLFDKGINSISVRLAKYAESTRKIKIRKGQPTDRTTLKDTGDFYRSFNVISQGDQFIIEASVEYAKYLVNRYGKEIIGVTDMNLAEFVEKYAQPEVEANITKIINSNKL